MPPAIFRLVGVVVVDVDTSAFQAYLDDILFALWAQPDGGIPAGLQTYRYDQVLPAALFQTLSWNDSLAHAVRVAVDVGTTSVPLS